MTASISVTDLQVDKHGTTICKVDSMQIAPGQRIAVVGPNGCGKSTFLRVLAGLETKFEGTCDIGVPQIDCVYIHQSPLLFRGKVLSNVTYGLRARGDRSTDRANDVLQKFGIAHLENREVAHLSGGERRRVAVARAVVLNPKLLLLDEPFAELDDEGIDQIKRVIEELTNSTIVIASPTSVNDTFESIEFPWNGSRETTDS